MVVAAAIVPRSSSAQRYKYPPGPPYRNCPNTLTIFDVQNPDTTQAPCHPATLDTVVGVRGVITGFDARPSAYGLYIQNGAGPWNGVDVFTGATNYNASPYNLAVGDLVEVTGTTQEFPNPNGETEIEGPDAVQSTNDIVISRISSGNPLPAFAVGTTSDYNWIPGISAATAEPREGCLVRINGPLKVARVATGLGVQGNNFLIVNPSAPADSVLIDGFTLTLFGTPPLNTPIDFVQGILNQRTGLGVNSYRIQLRDGNDISLAAPPNLVEAFSIEDDKLRLIYDKNLDPASAQNEGNYSLGSGIDGSTVDLATLIGGTAVELDITTALSDGDLESITSQNIGSATCPTCLQPPQTLGFVQGVLTVAQLQAPDPVHLSPCDDRSRFAGPGAASGPRLTVRGVALQSYGSLYYIEDPSGGQRSGISVFGPSAPLVGGHRYRIAGRVQEFGGETEIVNTVNILDEGAVALPGTDTQPVAVLRDTACDGSQSIPTGEDYEGVLVRVQEVVVIPFANPPLDPSPGGSFLIAQPVKTRTDTLLVSSLGGHYAFDADTGMILNVTGVLHQDATFRLLPRGDSDIEGGFIAGVFPPAGTDVVWHVLRIDLDVGDNGSTDETLIFNGRMKLTRGAPFTNSDGYRQIDFMVQEWKASAWSSTFGDSIHYILSPDTTQVSSQIIAETHGHDFPANFHFNVIFDAYLGSTLVHRRHHGRPKGHGFRRVPPDGDPINSPTITEFEPDQIVVNHPTLGVIRFKPKDCNDQQSATVGVGSPTVGTALLLRVWPSPTRGPATMSFVLPASGRVIGEIFDLGGRRIRQLELGRLAAGRHELRWDGRDGSARALANGIYVLRLSLNGQRIGATRFIVQR